MIKNVSDVERVVTDFVKKKFSVNQVHVAQVDFKDGLWVARGGFVTPECPLAMFFVKVDPQENILAYKTMCVMKEASYVR